MHANHWEMFAFCVLLWFYPEVLRNRFVVVRSDSMSACKCVRDLSAGVDSPAMAHLTRVFLSLAVRLNCRICPVHIAGVDNVLAVALSRGKWSAFGQAAAEWLQAKALPSSRFIKSREVTNNVGFICTHCMVSNHISTRTHAGCLICIGVA